MGQSFTFTLHSRGPFNSLEAPLLTHKPRVSCKILHLLPSPTLMSFVCLPPGPNNTAVTSGCRRERSLPSVRARCREWLKPEARALDAGTKEHSSTSTVKKKKLETEKTKNICLKRSIGPVLADWDCFLFFSKMLVSFVSTETNVSCLLHLRVLEGETWPK